VLKHGQRFLLTIDLAEEIANAPFANTRGVRGGTAPVVLPGAVDYILSHDGCGGVRCGCRVC